jgi:hypothetical protein
MPIMTRSEVAVSDQHKEVWPGVPPLVSKTSPFRTVYCGAVQSPTGPPMYSCEEPGTPKPVARTRQGRPSKHFCVCGMVGPRMRKVPTFKYGVSLAACQQAV